MSITLTDEVLTEVKNTIVQTITSGQMFKFETVLLKAGVTHYPVKPFIPASMSGISGAPGTLKFLIGDLEFNTFRVSEKAVVTDSTIEDTSVAGVVSITTETLKEIVDTGANVAVLNSTVATLGFNGIANMTASTSSVTYALDGSTNMQGIYTRANAGIDEKFKTEMVILVSYKAYWQLLANDSHRVLMSPYKVFPTTAIADSDNYWGLVVATSNYVVGMGTPTLSARYYASRQALDLGYSFGMDVRTKVSGISAVKLLK